MPETSDCRERVVVRFNPFGIESLTNSVERQAIADLAKSRPVRYGVSVFGDYLQDGEDLETAAFRLCQEITHHVAGGNRLAITSERRLRERGYALHEAIPPDKHYLVGGETLESRPQLDNLVSEFEQLRRQNPALKEG